MPTTKPNIVFFMVDQLSARWFEAARAGACPTPNFDRLCASGVTFTHAITSNPLCCPARATIATGLSTRGHGVLQNGYELDPSLPTFMRSLQGAGYRTGSMGKTHFHAHFHGVHPDDRPYGFDVAHNTEDPRGGEWLDWIRREHGEHFEAALAQVWAIDIPEFAAYGPQQENLRQRIIDIRRQFRWATPDFPDNNWDCSTLHLPAELSQTEWITRHGEDFIRGTPPDQPLYAHISYVQPHTPFYPPGECMALVDATKIPPIAPAEWAADPRRPARFSQTKPEDPAVWQKKRPYYFADIAHLDAQLERCMNALHQSGRLDSTYLIFVADHGEMLGDHGFSAKGDMHYDACIRVPLVIAGPGMGRGCVCDSMVQLEDLCPTVLDIARLPHPRFRKMGNYMPLAAEEIETLPGRSLLPLCRGEAPAAWRTAAYSESYNMIWSANPRHWARTIRTHEYRYTLWPCSGGEQLFHIATDPQEQHNLVGDPSHAGVRTELRDRLMEMIILQDYPLPFRQLYAMGVH